MDKDVLRNLAFASIISADNDKYDEEAKQEVIYRYELEKNEPEPDWEFILEPIGPDNRLLNLFK